MNPLPWLLCFLLVAPELPAAEPPTAEPPTAEEVRYVMGTTATVQAWATDSAIAALAVEGVFEVFDRVDSLMSTWRDDSVLNSLNGAGGGQWVNVGPEVCLVLQVAKTVAVVSEGAFDPTVLPLVRLWGFRGGQVAQPDSALLAATLATVDHGMLELDADSGRARLLTDGMAVDLGGIAKGYALDQAAEAMRRFGVKGGMIDLGGNLLAFGQGPHRQVGIVDPAGTDLLLATVPLTDAAVATSGQYERYLTIEGRRYGHILNPRTGWPVPPGVSATVLAKEAILADALATAAVVLGMDRGLALLEKTPGVEGVMALQDPHGGFDLKTTSGFASEPVAP
jgi:thiamine biosynthesis lipoprotein